MYLPIIIPVLHAVRHDGGVQFVGRQSRHHLLLETLSIVVFFYFLMTYLLPGRHETPL
jgi:hypothetical protein